MQFHHGRLIIDNQYGVSMCSAFVVNLAFDGFNEFCIAQWFGDVVQLKDGTPVLIFIERVKQDGNITRLWVLA
jgi:hypothetical protein